jgi:hypothetical protein
MGTASFSLLHSICSRQTVLVVHSLLLHSLYCLYWSFADTLSTILSLLFVHLSHNENSLWRLYCLFECFLQWAIDLFVASVLFLHGLLHNAFNAHLQYRITHCTLPFTVHCNSHAAILLAASILFLYSQDSPYDCVVVPALASLFNQRSSTPSLFIGQIRMILVLVAPC